MIVKKTIIKDLFKVKLKKFYDHRGIFYRNYCSKELRSSIKKKFIQSNISINKYKYTLRGFHYQKHPSKEAKLINIISGKIFNVTIDLRTNSNTYGKIYSILLDEKNNESIYIPEGCANAFLTMRPNTIVHYLMSDYYKPKSYICFNYKSRSLKIKWPHKALVISKQDKNSKEIFLDK